VIADATAEVTAKATPGVTSEITAAVTAAHTYLGVTVVGVTAVPHTGHS
jgi:hypothetical protein